MIARQDDPNGTQYARGGWCCQLPEPDTFGLTPVELYAHAVELFANGWSIDEIRRVVALPPEALS